MIRKLFGCILTMLLFVGAVSVTAICCKQRLCG